MSASLRHTGKAIVVAIAPALAVALGYYYLAAGQVGTSTLLDWFGTPLLKLAALVAQKVSRDLSGQLNGIAAGPGIAASAFLNYWLVFTGILANRRVWLVEWLWPGFPPFLDARLVRVGARPFEAYCEGEPFFGCEDSLAAIIDFAESGGKAMRWMAIRGRMGMGKTRLVIEAMKRLRARRWDVGLLSDDDWIETLGRHRFRRNTLILIDDFQRRGQALWAVLSAARQVDPRRRVRIVLADQVAPLVPLALDVDDREAIGATDAGMLTVEALEPDAAARLAPDLAHDVSRDRRPLLLKLGADPWGELGRRAAERLDLANELAGGDGMRLLAAAALGGPFDSATAKRIAPAATAVATLSRLFEGEDRARLRSTVPAFDPELLAQELLLQWIDRQDDAEVAELGIVIEVNPDGVRRMMLGIARERPALLRDSGELADDLHLNALNRLLALRPATWALLAAADAAALHAVLMQENPDLDALGAEIELLHTLWPHLQETTSALATLLRLRIHALAETSEASARSGGDPRWEVLAPLIDRLEALAGNRPGVADIQIARAEMWRCLALHRGRVATTTAQLGATTDWSESERALARLDALADAEDATPEIRLECAKGHSNATANCGAAACAAAERGDAPDWSGMERALTGLDALADSEDATDEIRLQCAAGHMNATVHYGDAAHAAIERGDAPDWSGLVHALARLDALADAKDVTPEIRLKRAEGHFNATVYYGNAARTASERRDMPDWSGVEHALARLDALADAEDATPEIRLQCASGHINATAHYGNAARAAAERGDVPDWSGLAHALARLDALADAEDATDEIRLQCAKGHMNATVDHGDAARAATERGDAPDWSGLVCALARLDALADHKDATDEIRLQCAKGHFNATVYYGNAARTASERRDAPDWSGLAAASARLFALSAQAWPATELTSRVFDGIMYAESSYRVAHNLDGAALQRKRLREFGWNCPFVPHIQQELERHFPHLTHLAQEKERSTLAAQKEAFARNR